MTTAAKSWITPILQTLIIILLGVIIAGGWKGFDLLLQADDGLDARLQKVEILTIRLAENQVQAVEWRKEHLAENTVFKTITEDQLRELWRALAGRQRVTNQDTAARYP